MSRDLTCNETMSVIDEAEAKDSERYFQSQGALNSRMPVVSGVAAQISRPLKIRGHSATHVINSSSGMSQKAHLLNSVVNSPVQPSTSQFNRSSAPKVVSGRPSSAMSSHSVFKPFHSPAEGSVIMSDDLSQPMAAIYRQLQQQQQQLRLNVTPQQSAFSLTRSHDFEQRTHGSTSPVVGLDARYFNPAALSRLRPTTNRSSTSSQQLLPSVATVNNTLRLAPQTRNLVGVMENVDSCRTPPNRMVSLSNSASGHETEANIPLSVRDKQISNSSVCFTASSTACDPSTSSSNSVFPASNSSGSPQLNNSHSSPHPGPSPRPSILRKIRDTSSGNSSAVRRLAFDVPVSRPASCSDTIGLSSGFNEDATSSLSKYINNGRSVGIISQLEGISRVLSVSDPNVRNVQSTPFGNLGMSKSGFERIESSPMQISEPDTPRKRMRKQQFDSSQAPEKIKMEVSLQLDANNLDAQKNVPLWRLAPPGQPSSSSAAIRSNEKSTRRRGRPRTNSRVDSPVVASTSYVDVDALNTEGSKPKKTKKHQVHSMNNETTLSENINPAGNTVLDISLLKGCSSAHDAIDNENVATNLRNFLQTLQNNRDRTTTFFDVHHSVAAVSNSSLDGHKKLNNDLELGFRNKEDNANLRQSELLTIEAMKEPSLLDGSENSSDLSPVEIGYASPTILASIVNKTKEEPSSHFYHLNSLDMVSSCNRSPLRLNTLGGMRKIRFNHFDKVESVKLADQKVRLLKAAKKKFREQEKLDMERKIRERMELKTLLLGKWKSTKMVSLATECDAFKKLSEVCSDALQASTSDFFDDVEKTFGKERSCSLHHTQNALSSEEFVRSVGLSGASISSSSAPHTEVTHLPRVHQELASVPSCSKTCVEHRNWKSEIAAIGDLLNDLVDKVVAVLAKSDQEQHLVDGLSARRTNETFHDKMCSSSNNVVNRIKQEMKDEDDAFNDRNLKWFFNDEEWDDYITKELEDVERALRLLGKDEDFEEVEQGVSKLAFRRIITTFDALRRAEVNENKDIVELLYIFLGFLRALDTTTYEQLNENFELLCNADDDNEGREKKRLNLIETFAVQIPRAHSTLKKARPYIPSSSTNFRPSLALINDLFEIKRLPEGKYWSEGDRSFCVNQRLECGKERPVFKRYSGDFNVDSELEGTEPNYLPLILKDLYEQETGFLASRLRLDSRRDGPQCGATKSTVLSQMCKNSAPDRVERHDDHRFSLDQAEVAPLRTATNKASVLDGKAVDQDNFANVFMTPLSPVASSESILIATNDRSTKTHASCTSHCFAVDGIGRETPMGNLTRTDRVHIRNRMRNIREQCASLLQTLRTNAMLASTAFELLNDHSDELLVDILPSMRTESEGSDGASEHSTNDDDLRESIETPVSLSLPPSP